MTLQSQNPREYTFKEYNDLFEEHGGTDSRYLKKHFFRFQNTFKRTFSTCSHEKNQVVVDIGAHWLHQSLFFALAGFKVEAFNLPTTFKKNNVRQLADAYGINLHIAEELETGECLYGLPKDSVDIVLFTEILEHITFNPVRFWKIIYHVMKPGGRIIVTTPNYYNLLGRSYGLGRFLSGHGGGLTVDKIVSSPTFGHHWKEYSMGEIRRYFSLLSSDFNCVKCEYIDDRSPAQKNNRLFKKFLMSRLPFLRPGLHVEVELVEKTMGIEATLKNQLASRPES